LTPEATRCEEAIRALYGDTIVDAPATLQSLALWSDPAGGLFLIAINENSPASETDGFALDLSRARADAIVTSGGILRAEPGLSHAMTEDTPLRQSLSAWRREVLGRTEPATSLVLARRDDIDLHHPLFGGERPAVVYTSSSTGRSLKARAEARGIPVVSDPSPSLQKAVAWLRENEGAKTVSLEIGAALSRPLYEKPESLVDEVMLSIFLEPNLPEGSKGPPFVDLGRLKERLPRATRAVVRAEASGNWSFSRLRVR